MNKGKLDEWDIKLIRYSKSGETDVEGYKNIWAERCAMDTDFCRPQSIASHLLSLAFELELIDGEYQLNKLIDDICPKNDWKFGMKRDKSNYWENVLAVVDSLFSLAEVQSLPGYVQGN